MDPATLIGVIGALIFIVVANVMEGGNPMSLMLFPPILLVVGGTIMVSIAGGTLADAKPPSRAEERHSAAPPRTRRSWCRLLVVALAEKARREGSWPSRTRWPTSTTLPVTGPDAGDRRHRPRGGARHPRGQGRRLRAEAKQSAKFFNSAGAYAPTIGIIGTVMGLVHVLENLAKPEELGHLIAGAFVATLWGVMSANIFFLPVGSAHRRLGELEPRRMELIIEGIAALQAGSNPRSSPSASSHSCPPTSVEPEAA